MVPSSALVVTSDGECLMCDGLFLGETVRLGRFELIAYYFIGLSLSPRRGSSGAAFMSSTHSGTPSPWWAMIEDSAEEFLTTLSGEGSSGLPSPRRRGKGAPFAPFTTTPWMENAPATQAMMMVPPRTAAPRPDTGLPFEQ
jgi:hypothetical protein